MRSLPLMVLLLAGGCAPATERQQAADQPVSAPVPPPVNTPAPGSPGTLGGLPDDRTPLAEPKGPIDPKSAEGAGQVVQHYGAYLEARQFAKARALWGSGGTASNQSEAAFAAAFADRATIHSEVGKPYDSEGAAGSIFIQVPFHLFGTTKAGKRFNLIGPLTLRRVNDVDGASPEQLRWHIVQSDLVAKG